MKATVEPLEANKVKLSVEIDEQEFDKAIDSAFARIAREVKIPGFRPGKAPRKVLEKRVGAQIARDEAIQGSLGDYYQQAVLEHDLETIAQPEITIASGQEAGPVSFEAVVEVMPKVSIAGYAGLQIELPRPEVTDEEIDSQIERLRQQYGELHTVSRPAVNGDHVTLDIKGSRHDEIVDALTSNDFVYEVGSGNVVPELDDNLGQAKVGDILKFNTSLPDGTEATIQVLVKEIKEKSLPEVNDEWATEVSELESVEKLRDDLRQRIGEVKRVQSQLALRDKAVMALIELVNEEPPNVLVDVETQHRLTDFARRLESQKLDFAQYMQATGKSQEDVISEIRAGAIEAVKADLALRSLAEAEDITVADEDISREVATAAEQLKTKPEKLLKQIEQDGRIAAVRSDIRKNKALGWLFEHISIVDEEGSPINREDIIPPSTTDAGASEV